MSRIDQLAEIYARHISLPWQRDLAGAQCAIFIVYNKADERRLRARIELFELETRKSGHGWRLCDLSTAFAEWMADAEYREEYFQNPEDLELKLEEEFPEFVAEKIKIQLTANDVDQDTVVAVMGVGSLFGFARVSEIMGRVEPDIRGRILVFFPGEHEDNNYRLLDARDGWNYLAVPLTV